MIETRPLNELFQIKSRFYRSVNIVADYGDTHAFADYILSPLGRSVLRRIGEGLKPGSKNRAWSIVGPYGAGKSALALFLARVMGHPKDADARERLRVADADLYATVQGQIPGWAQRGFLVVPIVGSREPLALAVLRGLADSLSSGPLSRESAALVQWLRSLARQTQSGQMVLTAVLTQAIEKVAELACSSAQRPLGLLIILDELGKLLEYAALNPDQGDIFYLQALAELAARSGDSPIGLIVILHQAFERYASRLSPPQQREWAKVQGRFEDIGFLEPQSELLRLLGQAITPQVPLDGLSQIIAQEAARAGELQLVPRELGSQDAELVLRGCAPLHPTVALVLGRLFRSRLAQNERSLFAFLTSGEPFGFQEYLHHEVWTGDGHGPFYRLDQLYDYVSAALGSTLYSSPQGKKWAEIEDALERLPKECSSLDSRLVKVIGLLGLLGDQRYLKASERVLTYALADGRAVTADGVTGATERLRAWGIAIYRQHKDAYSLWEGSDIDLEEQFQKGLDQIDRSARLSSLLQSRGQLRPYLAKRHLYETGTLRYFVPWIVEPDELSQVCDRPLGAADGAIVFVVQNNGIPVDRIVEDVTRLSAELPPPRRGLLLFAVPQDTSGLRRALYEVLAWDWVAQNTPELEGDSIGRKELAGRQIDAEGQLTRLCSECFQKTSSYNSWIWIYQGQLCGFRSAAELSSTLSQACDKVYYAAPIVRNELVNRRLLSSAATAARRTLIERMLAFPHVPRLGIDGFPPELSMYRSVLESSKLHHANGERWEFGPVDGLDVAHGAELWKGIDQFLTNTEDGKRCVSDLFELLRQPPYGLKNGLLPIYLAAAALHWDAEIAFYEKGTFVPKVNIALFERLIKSPKDFAIQRYRLVGARSYLFEKYSALLRGQAAPERATLLTAVRPIIAFVRALPPYTQLTSALSPEAIAVRGAVLAAREPHHLLFDDLPRAVGADPAQVSDDQTAAQAYLAVLKSALLELQGRYDRLLTTVQEEVLTALRLPGDLLVAREEITRRAQVLQEHVTDLRLRAFALRLADAPLPEREWLESVAACVASKPLKQWNDQDLLRYGIELADVSGRFRRVEELVVEAQGTGQAAASMVRVAVTFDSGEEHRDLVTVRPEDEAQIDAVADQLLLALQQSGASGQISLAAVAKLVRRISQQEGDN